LVPQQFFSASSFWYAPVETAKIDPNSKAIINAFQEQITLEEQAHTGPWINTTAFSLPLYTVPATQPTTEVKLEHTPTEPALQQAFQNVPLPPEAQPAAGHDHDLLLWQPATNKLWEFWHLTHQTDGWHAAWGGAIRNLTTNPGVYNTEAWKGAQNWWGTSASSLSLLGGLITLEDLKDGVINHALSMSIPNVRAGVYATPARRDDGKTTNPLALPEGAHLRLPPNLNLQNLHLPYLTLLIAQAAQRYGIIITDGSSKITFSAQDPTPTGTEPYKNPTGYYENQTPQQLLTTFPWNKLELLKMSLHRRRHISP
jgi:hypothetical protein